MVDAVKVFKRAAARNQFEKQRRIWQCFGVDYQSRIQKQRRIWEALYKMGKVDSPLPPLPPFQRGHTDLKLQPYVAPEMEDEYRELKQAVYDYIRHRNTYVREVDSELVDRLARVWALWLLYEKWTSLAPQEESSRLVDAFYKIDRMLSRAMQELHLTPSMRRKIADDLEEDDEVTRKLRRLLTQKHRKKKQEKKQEAGG